MSVANLFQPTLPARGATNRQSADAVRGRISTHAPRTGSDALLPRRQRRREDFNPRSPHGERRTFSCAAGCAASISTHAPRTGSDLRSGGTLPRQSAFQPTLPARGATHDACILPDSCFRFQPTLPARGATTRYATYTPPESNFNPRSPHGERRTSTRLESRKDTIFQPTLPARGATYRHIAAAQFPRHFNPRSPHGERLVRLALSQWLAENFNPRSPHGERREWVFTIKHDGNISTHAPRTGSDRRR